MAIYPVIMCGGTGTRLWPTSTSARPKQFAPLTDNRSTFQQTVVRLESLDGVEALIVVAGASQAELINEQLQAISTRAIVVLEPQARDSAAAMAAAAALIVERDPAGVAVVLAADHHIPDPQAFRTAVTAAVGAARDGHIVTLGVRPAFASTAYGYIRPAGALAGHPSVARVDAFVEKPGHDEARAYVQGGYYWNSGNFVVAAATLLEALDVHSPQTAKAARAALAGALRDDEFIRLSEAFCAAPRISIDYAVMEKTDRAAVLPVDFHWSDLGAWDAIWTESPKDAAGNAVAGEVVLMESENCLVRVSPGRPVAAIGLRNLAIIAEPDGLLVCDLERAQDVKRAFDELKARGALPQPEGRAGSLEALTADLHRWLWFSALPLWWAVGADHAAGGFEEALDMDGRAVGGPRRVRVQARQAHVYATAGRFGWPGPWRAAAAHGLDYLERAYRRSDGLYGQVAPDDAGAPPRLYDQAFVLLALASARQAGFGPEMVRRAEALLGGVTDRMRHLPGGFRESFGTGFQSNPHMHLFEAALAWIEAGEGGVWRTLADELADLALTRLIDPATGAIGEHFQADWSPVDGTGAIEPGHQFEWAWLMERWSRLSGRPQLLSAAKRLFAAGAAGVDPVRSVAVDEMNGAFQTASAGARLWPQTERLKASCGLFRATGEAGYRRHAEAAARSLRTYLATPTPGLWRDKLDADGAFEVEPAPASSLYHIAGAVFELGLINPDSSAV